MGPVLEADQTECAQVGLRLVEAVVDSDLGGWLFRINGERIYLEGGNWIATDQLQRFSTDRQRSVAEYILFVSQCLVQA